MIGLIIWNIILTLALALGALVTLGKFSRLEREVFENLNKEFFEVFESLKNLLTKVKTLEENQENLQKTSVNYNVVEEQMQQFLSQIAKLAETQEGLRQDVDLLFKADKEHPVLAPVPSKGGRPRKEQQ